MDIKKLNVEELLKWIGIEADSDDNFKTKFNEKYIPEDMLDEHTAFKSRIGKITGSQTRKAIAIAKKYGVEIGNADIKDKVVEDVFDLALTRLQDSNNTVLEDLKKNATGTADENFKALEKKFNQIKSDYETVQTANNGLKADLEKEKTTGAETLKKEKLNFRTKNLWSDYKWADGTDDLKKRGFMSMVSEKYKFDLDDTDNLLALDAKTGSKITNPNRNSTFLTPEEILQSEGITQKVFKSNADGGKPAGGNGWSGFGKGEKKEPEPVNNGMLTARPLAVNTYPKP